MDMDGEQVPVRLVYRITTADVAQALRARDARVPAGRRKRTLTVGFGALLLGFGGLALMGDGPLVKPLVTAGAGLLMLVLALLGPQLTARAFAGLLAKAGETTAVVDATGLQVSTADTQTRINWAAQPLYTETADTFVTLSVAKRAVAMTILPKRGAADPADIDRLRAVLDRNLQRL
ncbi:YcxB family protein [Streptomyces sp. NPDC048550]|uniref:YcxB family protein n=1 Tax=unclassified Streptomyces TaxID=2593676 RepID=UPI0022548334|nr:MULTISPECIES: YcxB family protein [unclassified Streptomyces]MCX5147816.1 YcxB family protein [Streptomyces sp. NBC_00320]WSN50933.1 YcxB family protein [Streptomyces sp. NBC_01296]WSW59620.1 YcxB family protein [Streptomyces sp. NBC_00998]